MTTSASSVTVAWTVVADRPRAAIARIDNRRLKVKLLNRTTRFVRTTEVGQRYLDDARRILAEADEADEAAAGVNAAPRGHLAITAPVLFGRMFVMPLVVEYLNRYPDTAVSAVLLDRVVNLLEEGVDVGIRIGELPDSNMQATAVGSVRLVVCASKEYLRRHGVPRTPEELLQHTIIASSAGSASISWRFGGRMLRIEPRLAVTTNDGAIEAALRGFGITRMLSYQVSPYVRAGDLRTVLEEHEPAPRPINIVHREGRHACAKVRAFVDLIAERLRADRALS
jgi:DNA-binding transcriptional LysR family regulator